MKKFFMLLAALVLLGGAQAFAQSGTADDMERLADESAGKAAAARNARLTAYSAEDGSDGEDDGHWLMDFYLGGVLTEQWHLKPNDYESPNIRIKPGFAFGYNAWINRINDKLSLGPIVRFTGTFPQKVDVPYEAQAALYYYTGEFLESTIEAGPNDTLLNLDGLLGYGLNFKPIEYFGVAVKLGLAVNYNSVSRSWTNALEGETSFSSGYFMLGAGLDLGLQGYIPLNRAKHQYLYVELGASFSYHFYGYFTYDITINAGPNDTLFDTNGDPVTEIRESGSLPGETKSFLGFGAPYLVIGYSL
ncbi:MAG: hypothetical protein LBR16_01400 [Treponema sp.]|jgi:hypothetical protein|nr:hypothetical protein [Treponema sp.]